MKHRIRQNVINEYGLPVTKVETVQGELGSGLFDKNGNEIFEGDRLNVIFDDGKDGRTIETITVVFEDGAFRAKEFDDPLTAFLDEFEIVGHADD